MHDCLRLRCRGLAAWHTCFLLGLSPTHNRSDCMLASSLYHNPTCGTVIPVPSPATSIWFSLPDL